MVKKRASERIEFIDPGGDDHRVLFDLSKGGLCCLYSRKLEKGDHVRVTLNDMQVRAIVSYAIERTDGFRMGMQFWHIRVDEQKQIDALVEQFSRGVPISCRIEEAADDN